MEWPYVWHVCFYWLQIKMHKKEMANPILVQVYRGEVLESFHRGIVCIVDNEGKIIYSLGNTQQICFPRSALKFFQQIPLLTCGALEYFNFTQQEIAILCGSHNGEAQHVQVVQNILDKISLTEADLECGAQMPTLKEDQNYLIKNDLKPRKIMNNCSGKHAGFLAYCVYKNLPIKDYINPKHQLHLDILEIIADFHEYSKAQIQQGVDGCSAPIFAFPVYNQAVAYKNLINPIKFNEATQKACKLMTDAIIAYPEMIAGKNRYCTDLMALGEGKLIGKTGADGIYSIGIFEKNFGICIKVDDGKMGPQYNVAQAVVEQLNILNAENTQKLRTHKEHINKNFGGIETGVTKVSEEIKINF